MGLEVGAVAAIVGAVAAVGGAVASQVQAGKTASEQKRQNRRINATNAAKAIQAKRQTLREERVRRAQLMAQAEAAGISGSSTAISGEALVGTNAAQQVGQISSSLDNTNALSAGNQSIAESQQREQLFSAVSSIGSSVFSSTGGAEQLDTLFK